MIDVDAIAKECERMIGEGYGHLPVIGCGKASDVAELIVMLRDAQKDVERYRWLRDNSEDGRIDQLYVTFPSGWYLIVDEAMKCGR